MFSVRRTTTAALMAVALATAGTVVATAPASAATEATLAPASISAVFCGYDNRTPPPEIWPGATGNTVREAQCLLLYRGYSVGAGGVDGIFGSSTENAVRSFQANNGLGISGGVGQATWNKLRNG